MKKSLRSQIRLAGLRDVVGILTCIATCAGFLGDIWWGLELSSHFRVQYAVLLTGLMFGFAVARKPIPALTYGLFAAVNLSLILPFYIGRPTLFPGSPPPLRVVLLNVNTANSRYDRVKAYIETANPDIALFEEVNDRWIGQLEPLKTNYPHGVSAPRDDNFGIALFSKIRLTNAFVKAFGTTEAPSVVAEFEFGGRSITMVGTHPVPPRDAEYARLRNEQLAALGEFAALCPQPVILLGDLNCTPWSPYFRRLLRGSGLVDSARGFGIQPTWPGSVFPLWIPLDHCLLAPPLRTVGREVGPNVGSDHFPLLVEVTTAP